MKIATRISFSLLIVMLLIMTPARVQESAASASTARDKSIQWRVHLALQLVKYPNLSGPQVRVILDAISLSTPEFFVAASSASLKKSEADNALQSLIQRAQRKFPADQTTELFAMAGDEAEEAHLKLYYDASSLPLLETKALFRSASSKNKSHLWRTHLALFLATRPELKESQKEIILAAMSLITPEFFEIRSTDSAWKHKVREPLRSLEERIVATFSFAEATKIFAKLGGVTEFANESVSCTGFVVLKSISYEPLNDSNRIEIKDKEEKRKDCDCSTESDYCPLWKMCRPAACTSTQSGCGTFWAYSCNGSCQ
ncbi:MAG TPA: bacteriocin fulvocin C-related protein [Pyrinomonadaceae bacterium]|nr:bacteriocin fulvocin C-related protein [Pyrinomonadaceae bacterium]